MNPPSPCTGSNTIAATSSARDERLERTADRVDVVERDAVDLRRERPEPLLVRPRLRREREREVGAAVEGALEADHGRAAGVGPRELDRVLDRLGAGVEERGLRRARRAARSASRRSDSVAYTSYGTTVKSVCEKRSSCSCAAWTTCGWEWPTFRQPTPPAKSTNVLPSTSVRVAPRASAAAIGKVIAERRRDARAEPLEDLPRPRAGDLGLQLDRAGGRHRERA